MSERRKRKPAKREKQQQKEPDLYALSRLIRPDRKPVGGWVKLGKYTRLKGTAYA
jgi:hypothetical protein